jgi:hypothetical protein
MHSGFGAKMATRKAAGGGWGAASGNPLALPSAKASVCLSRLRALILADFRKLPPTRGPQPLITSYFFAPDSLMCFATTSW